MTAGGKHIEAELAAGQFPGWRGKAIEAQVIQVLAASNGKWSKNSDERTAALAEAWELRNESLANRDFDSALTRRYQAILICVALAILIIAVFGSAFVNPELSERCRRVVGSARLRPGRCSRRQCECAAAHHTARHHEYRD